MTRRFPRSRAVLRIVLALSLGALPATGAAAQIRPADHDSRLPAGPLLRNCERDRPFILGSRVIDSPQFGCPGLSAGGPASFSFHNDRISGQTALRIAAGLAIPLTRGNRLQDGLRSDALRLTQVPLSFFIQTNGTLASDPADDRGSVRSGLKLDMVFEGGATDQLVLTSALYHQTDMRLRQTGYGLLASVTVQNARRGIGAARNPAVFGETGGYFYVVPRATFDIFRGAGSAGLTDRNWVGASLAFIYRNDDLGIFRSDDGRPHGLQVRASAQRFVDLRTRQGASLGEVRLDLFTNRTQTSSLSLSYRRGRLYESGEAVNEVTAGIGLSF